MALFTITEKQSKFISGLDTDSCLYIIGNKYLCWYKLGYSKQKGPGNLFLKRRIAKTRASVPFSTEIVGLFGVSKCQLLERLLQERFCHHHLQNGWFKLSLGELTNLLSIISSSYSSFVSVSLVLD